MTQKAEEEVVFDIISFQFQCWSHFSVIFSSLFFLSISSFCFSDCLACLASFSKATSVLLPFCVSYACLLSKVHKQQTCQQIPQTFIKTKQNTIFTGSRQGVQFLSRTKVCPNPILHMPRWSPHPRIHPAGLLSQKRLQTLRSGPQEKIARVRICDTHEVPLLIMGFMDATHLLCRSVSL